MAMMGLSKSPSCHSGGAPQAAGAGHIAAVGGGSRAINWHGSYTISGLRFTRAGRASRLLTFVDSIGLQTHGSRLEYCAATSCGLIIMRERRMNSRGRITFFTVAILLPGIALFNVAQTHHAGRARPLCQRQSGKLHVGGVLPGRGAVPLAVGQLHSRSARRAGSRVKMGRIPCGARLPANTGCLPPAGMPSYTIWPSRSGTFTETRSARRHCPGRRRERRGFYPQGPIGGRGQGGRHRTGSREPGMSAP